MGTVAARATGEVDRLQWQRWAASVGDHNPLWFDADYARANGYDDVICPPLYLQYVVLGVASLDGLRPDGSSGAVSGGLAFPRAPRRMAGGESTDVPPARLSPRRDRDGPHHRVDRRKARQVRPIRLGDVAHHLPEPAQRTGRRSDDVDDRQTVRRPMTAQLCYEDVEPGDEIPPLVVTVDATQMFFFSAATYNGHRIHYDKAVGHRRSRDTTTCWCRVRCSRRCWPAPSPTGSAAGAGWSSYSVQNRAVAYPGEELAFGGVVTAKRIDDGVGLVDLDIAGRRGDDVLMPGTATVALPAREA